MSIESHEVPERVVMRPFLCVDSVTCSVCGDIHKRARPSGHDQIKWSADEYDLTNTCVSFSYGVDDGIDCSMTYRIYDVCPKCFVEHLEPFLKSLGAKPRECERYY